MAIGHYDYEAETIQGSPYDPAYGFTDKFRLNCIELAGAMGCKLAADLVGVSTASIYRWRKDYENRP